LVGDANCDAANEPTVGEISCDRTACAFTYEWTTDSNGQECYLSDAVCQKSVTVLCSRTSTSGDNLVTTVADKICETAGSGAGTKPDETTECSAGACDYTCGKSSATCDPGTQRFPSSDGASCEVALCTNEECCEEEDQNKNRELNSMHYGLYHGTTDQDGKTFKGRNLQSGLKCSPDCSRPIRTACLCPTALCPINHYCGGDGKCSANARTRPCGKPRKNMSQRKKSLPTKCSTFSCKKFAHTGKDCLATGCDKQTCCHVFILNPKSSAFTMGTKITAMVSVLAMV